MKTRRLIRNPKAKTLQFTLQKYENGDAIYADKNGTEKPKALWREYARSRGKTAEFVHSKGENPQFTPKNPEPIAQNPPSKEQNQ